MLSCRGLMKYSTSTVEWYLAGAVIQSDMDLQPGVRGSNQGRLDELSVTATSPCPNKCMCTVGLRHWTGVTDDKRVTPFHICTQRLSCQMADYPYKYLRYGGIICRPSFEMFVHIKSTNESETMSELRMTRLSVMFTYCICLFLQEISFLHFSLP